ncbi:hypothetical protein MYX75_04070 [Acidobacteria bacterium AH-259-A15]|nr:hypothetical protein [Acidobacteria bacterium AH-259-A15]
MKTKPQKKRRLFALAALLVLGIMGLGIAAAVTQVNMDELMQMMKQKMMNRPEAMKSADEAIQDQKLQAMKAGKYTCCLKHPCDFCALKMGECPCGMNAAKDMPVCNECKGSWHAGDGAIPGKTPDQIKTLPRGM